MRLSRISGLLALINAAVSSDPNSITPLYKDPTAPIEARVTDLLSRMSLQDKTAQLIQGDINSWLDPKTAALNSSGLQWSMSHRAGQFWAGASTLPWANLSAGIAAGQSYLVRNTTLAIPAFAQAEGLHGLVLPGATIFGSPIAAACAWDPDLVRDAAAATAAEARALGITQLFAPVADLARELRFGRVEETFGEDAFLAGELARAVVRGFQGRNVSAVVKHFAGFASPEQGINTAPVHGGQRELRTTHLPAFRRAIVDGGAWAVMSAYHAYDGVPVVASKMLLTKVLREEWGFEYWVTSDAGGESAPPPPFLCLCSVWLSVTGNTYAV
jgi:beta-glucosidase